MSAGKGDVYRKVDKNKFDENYEAIFGKKKMTDVCENDKEIKKSVVVSNKTT